jgi:hypothetical protein
VIRFADPAAAAVADRLIGQLRTTFDERLGAVVVHGSAVTGYISGFSDFDFLLALHGPLCAMDAATLYRHIATDPGLPGPFTYLQASEVLDLQANVELRARLVPDGFVVATGDLPAAWGLHDEASLRAESAAVLRRLPARLASNAADLAIETGPRRVQRVRLAMTDAKPAMRSLLVALGEPALEVWRLSYTALEERLRLHRPELAGRLQDVLALLRGYPGESGEAGESVLFLLDAVAAEARRLRDDQG